MKYERYFKEVEANEHNGHFSPEDFKCPPPSRDLTKSVSEHGIIEPVIISEWDGAWTVMGGQRRILIGMSLGISIPCAVYNINPEDHLAWIPILNDTSSPNPIHNLFAIKGMISQNKTMDEIKQLMFMSKQQIERTLTLDRLPMAIKDAMEEGKIAITTGYTLAKPQYEQYYDDVVADFYEQKPITGTYVKNLSRKRRQTLVASLFDGVDLPGAHSSEENPQAYSIFDGATFVTFAPNRTEARSAAMMVGNDAKVFKLIPVEFQDA